MRLIGYRGHTIVITQKKRYITVEVTGPKHRASYRSTMTATNALDYLADVEMGRVDATCAAEPNHQTEETPMLTKSKRIGNKSGKSRLWIEGKLLSDHGFTGGASYRVEYTRDALVISLDAAGPRRVSDCAKGPIIDVCDAAITEWAAGRTDGVMVLTVGRIMFSFSA